MKGGLALDKPNEIAAKAVFRIKNILKNERGETVNWLLVIMIGVILAVIAFKGLAPGIRGAVENMSNALIGN